MDINKCMLCPRECGSDRRKSPGTCGAEEQVRVARVGLHKWEEPCISFGKGSGTVFFSGCSLKCVFCQNREISRGLKGKNISTDKLAEEFLRLQEMGASNINLVTPTHFTEHIITALDKVKHRLCIPVCYNCGGYEKVETLKMLDGYIDIFMPDIKYYSSEYSKRYSGADNYFEVTAFAVEQMHKMVGYAGFDSNGHMKKGVLIRHLVLPGLYRDSFAILEYLASNYDASRLAVSLMSQYFPTEACTAYPEINRKITTLEYRKVVKKAEELGFTNGFIQQRTSAKEEYVPDFNYPD